MRRILVILILSVAFAPMLGYASPDAQAQTTTAAQPNIVYVVTDDMRKDDLAYMPKTQNLIFDEGITYDNAFVTTSQCCPSRSSMLTGKYVHNHGVKANDGSNGGAGAFKQNGNEQHTVATWLHNAGYTNMLAGKYLNGYKGKGPPGWDEWHGMGGVNYGSGDTYTTDRIRDQGVDFIDRQQGPFFVYLAPVAPHDPATPAPRHKDLFQREQAPRPPSFNEDDVSDKPNYVRSHEKSDEGDIDAKFRKRIRTLQAVDDLVEAVVNELQKTGKLDDTYLVFTSDNGWMQGEHRLGRGKNTPYEPSIHMPLGIRGPGIPAGRTTDQLVINEDYAPTFAELGGATIPDGIDGRSLVPTFASDAPSWRHQFLEEFYDKDYVPPHASVRTESQKYVEYKGGFKEFYDLASDPDEMENLEETQPSVDDSALVTKLSALRDCSGQSCRDAEDAP